MPHDEDVQDPPRKHAVDQIEHSIVVRRLVDPASLSLPMGVVHQQLVGKLSELGEKSIERYAEAGKRSRGLRIGQEGFEAGDELRLGRTRDMRMAVEQSPQERRAGAMTTDEECRP